MIKNKNILLGVSGGIAAYKSVEIVSRLKKLGANVKVVMTKAATEFIAPLTFQTMSKNEVYIDMFKLYNSSSLEHIELAKWADIIVIAPATANTIAKYANGICDNLLTTILMASRTKIIIVPAMNTYMLENHATSKNLKTLLERDCIILDTQNDLLACNDIGSGKMLEPIDIVEEIDSVLTEKDLIDKKIIITSGPTIEPIDPVRYITNHSSGKMGYSLAKQAQKRGASVTLISGPTSIDIPKVDNFIRVNTTKEMFDAVKDNFDKCHVLIKAAAPADYRPKNYVDEKIKKTGKGNFNRIDLEANVDIAKYFGSIKDKQKIIGFAAESNDEIKYGKQKLKSKNFDFIVVNNIKVNNAGFKSDNNTVTVIDSDNIEENIPSMKKIELADIILDKVIKLF